MCPWKLHVAGREWPVSHLPWQSVGVFLWFLTWYLSLSRGGRDLSPLGGANCRNKSIPAHFFSTLMLVGVRKGQIRFMMNLMTFLSLLPAGPPVSCMAENTLSDSCPFIPGLAAATSCLPIAPHSPFMVSWNRGDPIPHPYEGAAASFSLPEHQVHLWRATGTCWDLARLMPASAPPCAVYSQVFNYSSLWEAAGNTGDFGGCWLGTSAASSPCFPWHQLSFPCANSIRNAMEKISCGFTF